MLTRPEKHIDSNIAEPTVASLAALFTTSGIRAELGSNSAVMDDGKTCLNIHGNTVNQTAGPGASEVRILGRDATITALPYLGIVGPADANLFIMDNTNIILRPGGATLVDATSNEPFQSNCPPQ